ncbi:hypothetical protein WN48_09145 [Eufriesea mexicana]|nr:hypothetical protein WN48_09145 [Eufriesea mexicana]
MERVIKAGQQSRPSSGDFRESTEKAWTFFLQPILASAGAIRRVVRFLGTNGRPLD